jgi:hypothetical protein
MRGRMAKADIKPKPKKTNDKEQSERFKEAARNSAWMKAENHLSAHSQKSSHLSAQLRDDVFADF